MLYYEERRKEVKKKKKKSKPQSWHTIGPERLITKSAMHYAACDGIIYSAEDGIQDSPRNENLWRAVIPISHAHLYICISPPRPPMTDVASKLTTRSMAISIIDARGSHARRVLQVLRVSSISSGKNRNSE